MPPHRTALAEHPLDVIHGRCALAPASRSAPFLAARYRPPGRRQQLTR